MFDNPKKELERLQAQLLAAEAHDEEELDELYDDTYEEFEEDDSYDAELDALLNGTPLHSRPCDDDRDVRGRATGFDADDYEMESDRYVPAPKKKGIGCLASFALTLALSVIAVTLWWLWRLL